MPILHIANTNFEWELSYQGSPPLNPIFLQLQFLPFLYAKPQDGVLVSHLPDEPFFDRLKNLRTSFPTLELVTTAKNYTAIESWGASLLLAKWAKENGLVYDIPNWDVVKEVNSKAFSYLQSPKLEGSALLSNLEETKQWIAHHPGPKVLKTCFGVSGRGHVFIHDKPADLKMVEAEFKQGRPVIGEPWVERILDFSTQWHIANDKTIAYLGETLCYNDAKGRYQQNRIGDAATLFGNHLHFLQEHKQVANTVLKYMADLGYFGHVGIDAMLYLQNDRTVLHPIVEINARKTMGWVALRLQQLYFPNQHIAVAFTKEPSAHPNLLPDFLVASDKSVISFARHLIINAANA